MRLLLPVSRPLRSALCVAVWAGSVGAAVWLYRGGVGTGDAVAIAEVKEYKVAPSALGRLTSLSVVEGERVSPGQVVAQLETELLEQEISVAEARLRQVSSEIPATGASLAVSSLQADRTFESEIDAAQVEVQAARASFSSGQAELTRITLELDQQRNLVKRGLTKADRLPELELRRTALEQAVQDWPKRIEAIDARHRAAVARLAEWRRTNSEQPGGSRKAQLQPFYGKVREQQESIRLLKTQLRHTVLRAPSDAYVSSVLARPGDVIRPGDPILVLVEARPHQVIAYIDDHRGAALTNGVTVLAQRRDAVRTQIPATVASVAGNVTQLPLRLWTSPTVPAWGRAVYVQLPPDARVDPGEIVDLRVTPGAAAENRPLTASRR